MNLVLDDTIRVPVGVTENLRAFRRWTKSDGYPDRGDYFFLNGDLWVDLSRETLLQNHIRNQITTVLTLLVTPARTGIFCGGRMRLVNVPADISCEPDGMFISYESRKAGRVRWEQGPESLEVIGTPDVVVEIVSSHSIQKDTVVLRELYAIAGIQEYWLVNPLGGQLAFDILRHTSKGYAATRKSAGWQKSTVFGKSFRLVQEDTNAQLPEYRLLVR